jgi:thermitase
MFPSTPPIAALAAACLAVAPSPASCARAGVSRTGGHAAGLGAAAITIAILDTGVSPVPALAKHLIPGHDFVDDDARPLDRNGHGTAMASIAAASPDPALGIAGVCGRCAIVPVRVAGGAGIGTAAIAAAGLRWSVAQGVRVVNFSLTSCAEDPELTQAIADATSQGVVVVLAAGNGGSSDPESDGYPAAVNPEAITVGAADPTGRLYPWSNHGGWVQIAAPGTARALTPAGTPFDAEGTSVAAAYVSGVVGLMLSANPALTPQRIDEILVATGTAEPGLDVTSGRLVNRQAAVAAAYAG